MFILAYIVRYSFGLRMIFFLYRVINYYKVTLKIAKQGLSCLIILVFFLKRIHLVLSCFSFVHWKTSRFRASRRSCEIGCTGNANFATAGSAGEKKKQDRREKRPRNCAVAGLDYTVTLASSMENALSRWRRPLHLASSHGLSPSLASIRDGKRNRTKGTSPIAPQRLPHSSLPLFFTRLSSCSSRIVPPALPLLTMHKFTRSLRSDRLRNESVNCASLFNFASTCLILPSAVRLFYRSKSNVRIRIFDRIIFSNLSCWVIFLFFLHLSSLSSLLNIIN